MYYYAETKKQILPEVFADLVRMHGFSNGSMVRMPNPNYWVDLFYLRMVWTPLMYEASNNMPDRKFRDTWIQFTYDVCDDCAVIYRCDNGVVRPFAVVRKYMPE